MIGACRTSIRHTACCRTIVSSLSSQSQRQCFLRGSKFDYSTIRFATAHQPTLKRNNGVRTLSSSSGAFSSSFDDFLNADNAEDETTSSSASRQQDEERLRRAEETRQALLLKKGRGWTDPWDLDEMTQSTASYEELPDWAPNLVSRVSQERVQIYSSSTSSSTGSDVSSKIPLLSELANLPLPPPPPPHPGLGQTKAYALYRKRAQYKHLFAQVQAMAQPRIPAILAMADWHDKQDAIDVLFEEIEFALKEKEVVLGKHPQFGSWVERALEQFLRSVHTNVLSEGSVVDPASIAAKEASSTATIATTLANIIATNEINTSTTTPPGLTAVSTETTTSNALSAGSTETTTPMTLATQQPNLTDEFALPIFMDCYDSQRGDTEEKTVPSILIPLKPKARGQSVGRMVEEWELSPYKSSKRIMLRQCTRSIAQAIVNVDAESESSNRATRIFVHGRQGVGKTSAIAAVVASARASGAIVLYMPEGDMLHVNGFYIEPNAHRAGIFDLPLLSKEVCQNMIDTHKEDLGLFTVESTTMERFFTDEQLSRMKGYVKGDRMPLIDLFSYGADKVELSAMCFAAGVDVLMQQESKQFIMVLDEFNCFFQPGKYFHQDFDFDVKKPIPYSQISLFQPILHAMAVGPFVVTEGNDTATPVVLAKPALMKRGAVIVGTTESHAVSRQITDDLLAHVVALGNLNRGTTTPGENGPKTSELAPICVVSVPRLSALEVEHMLANYEATGVGKLRLDRGETVMNAQEVAFLRVVSGGEAQKLMNACMM